jgi:hypothetical protein
MKLEISHKSDQLSVSGDSYFSAPTAKFSHVSGNGEINFKDCRGNYAVLCDDETEEYVLLEDLATCYDLYDTIQAECGCKVTYCFNSESNTKQETEKYLSREAAEEWLKSAMERDGELCGLVHANDESPDTEEIMKACGVSEERLVELKVI